MRLPETLIMTTALAVMNPACKNEEPQTNHNQESTSMLAPVEPKCKIKDHDCFLENFTDLSAEERARIKKEQAINKVEKSLVPAGVIELCKKIEATHGELVVEAESIGNNIIGSNINGVLLQIAQSVTVIIDGQKIDILCAHENRVDEKSDQFKPNALKRSFSTPFSHIVIGEPHPNNKKNTFFYVDTRTRNPNEEFNKIDGIVDNIVTERPKQHKEDFNIIDSWNISGPNLTPHEKTPEEIISVQTRFNYLVEKAQEQIQHGKFTPTSSTRTNFTVH